MGAHAEIPRKGVRNGGGPGGGRLGRRAIRSGEDGLPDLSPENVASVRVAEKCGYRELPQAVYKGQPIRMYERTAESGKKLAV